ncbi:KH domain-containing protein [Kovacikia minuta CCNUW1]|uniref:KH domain-containing protein n=1 Tax=Kovacikia minuta TaxID=2931930 RepID=UPI001CCEE58C|nr:KH domain-containing protein [Kovacikia minuta]UBF27621.1 KH domain-containing protein [Kovacikia minuta CCNUW1]
MPETVTNPSSPKTTPDYIGLVKFLVKPFLETPDSLSIDCEVSHTKSKVWVRLAFESSDKGRVFGRGGRNIQAIRSVLEGAARSFGYTAHLDVFGSAPQDHNDGSESHAREGSARPSSRRASGAKEPPKPRSRHTPSQ